MLGPRRGSVKDLGSGLSPPPRRGYSPLGASRELGGEVSSRVRALRAGDEAAVLALWSGNVTEHLEVLSYDRWGPGVPVPARPEVDEVAAVTVDPYDGVKRLIGRYLTDPALFCLVAQDGGPDLDGFLTGAVTPSVLDDSSRGVIGEVYVRPQRRRRGLAGGLVAAAVGRAAAGHQPAGRQSRLVADVRGHPADRGSAPACPPPAPDRRGSRSGRRTAAEPSAALPDPDPPGFPDSAPPGVPARPGHTGRDRSLDPDRRGPRPPADPAGRPGAAPARAG